MRMLLSSIAVLIALSPAFAVAAGVHNDFNGDGRADLLWRNADTGVNVIWRNGVATDPMAVQSIPSRDWRIAGSGDFDGDHHADILWRNHATGAMVIWYSGSATRAQRIYPWADVAWANVDDPGWDIVGIGDFNADGVSDIFWRNRLNGNNAFGIAMPDPDWGGPGVFYAFGTTRVANLAWKIEGIADFDGDGRAELLWRNPTTGANVLWWLPDHTSLFAGAALSPIDPAWAIAGTGDFNGDRQADVLWRNPLTGANALWPSANAAAHQDLGPASSAWWPASIADLDGDLHADIVWRNTATGFNTVWMSANRATSLRLTTVTNQAWKIVP